MLLSLAAIGLATSCGALASPILGQLPEPSARAGDAPPIAAPVRRDAPARDPERRMVGGSVIRVGTASTHRSNSLVLGTNRNHVAEYFPGGARKLERLRELRPTWGDRKYLYRVGHGITDGRVEYDYMNGFHFEKVWGRKGGYPYDDIRHALAEANELGAEQIHVVNFGTGTAEEAGRYVAYLNDPKSRYRKDYPYEGEPVRRFEIGNEISWTHARGHAEYAPDEKTYARRAREFAVAMRTASPVPIRIGAVATTNSNWLGDGWSGGALTVANILDTMGDQVDFLIYHGYPSWPLEKEGDLLTVMAQNAWNRRKLTTEILPAIKQHAHGRPVKVANTEFFTELYRETAAARGMLGALYSADTLATALDLDLETAIQFCFDHGDLADASFFLDREGEKITPIYRVQRLLAQHWGDQALGVAADGVRVVPVKGAATTVDMPALGLAASRGADGRIYVLVVNRLDKEAVETDIDFGFTAKSVKAHRVLGPAGWLTAPDKVREESVDLHTAGRLNFPAASVTVLEAGR